MLLLASSATEPSALIKWMYAGILIAVMLICAGIVYGIAKLKERISRKR